MRSQLILLTIMAGFVLVLMSSCFSNKGQARGGGASVPDDGQLHGIASGVVPKLKSALRPFGMVFVPPGTFHMGPSDEDVNYNLSARNKQVSINGFWMDATEITNNEYRQFVIWTRDSLAAIELNYVKVSSSGDTAVDWKKISTIKYGDRATMEKLTRLVLAPDNRLYNRIAIDPAKILYNVQQFNLYEAAKGVNIGMPAKNFMINYDLKIYPDTLVWMRDFSYSYNEPMAINYFRHPSYGNYPVVGVSWKQANAFCNWRTHYLNSWLEKNKRNPESDFRLPTEAEWEYAARGGRSQTMFPWGGPYLRNKKGCLLANFKPGRGNYQEDGGFYTTRADAYWPNDFGLYNMSGNVAEWTSSHFNKASYDFQHDMNPNVRWDAIDSDPPRMKLKVVRGGSWKDTWNRLQVSERDYEYQDTVKSYIGFRCVIDLPPNYQNK